MNAPSLEDTIIVAINCGLNVMGDDFIGYKFIGEQSEFWNGLLFKLHNEGVDVASKMNKEWLSKQGISVLEHDSFVWNM